MNNAVLYYNYKRSTFLILHYFISTKYILLLGYHKPPKTPFREGHSQIHIDSQVKQEHRSQQLQHLDLHFQQRLKCIINRRGQKKMKLQPNALGQPTLAILRFWSELPMLLPLMLPHCMLHVAGCC